VGYLAKHGGAVIIIIKQLSPQNEIERKKSHAPLSLYKLIASCRRQAAQVGRPSLAPAAWSSLLLSKYPHKPRQSHPFLPAYLVALAAGLARPGAPLLLRDVPTFLASFSNTSSSTARPSPRYRRRPAILQQHKHSPPHVPPGLASCSRPASAAAVMVRWEPSGRVVSQGIDAVVREVKVAKDNGCFCQGERPALMIYRKGSRVGSKCFAQLLFRLSDRMRAMKQHQDNKRLSPIDICCVFVCFLSFICLLFLLICLWLD